MTLEKISLRLGYIPLTDCLPLVVAQERGFFEEQGLKVELCCEPSWANIRDKLIVGHFDGAQLLVPMLLAASLPPAWAWAVVWLRATIFGKTRPKKYWASPSNGSDNISRLTPPYCMR